MAIVLELEAQNFSITDVTSIDVTLSGSPTNGWVLIAGAVRRSLTDTGCTITGPSGFTDKIDANTMQDAVNSNRSYIKYKVASGDGTTYTFTNGGTDTSEEIAAWVGAYSGLRTDSFTGATNFDHSTTGSPVATPSLSVTTTGTLSLIVHVAGLALGGGPNEWPITGVGYSNSFTSESIIDGRTSDGDVICLVGTRIVTSAAAYSTVASWTQPNATPVSCCMAEFFGVTASAPVANVTADDNPITYLDTETAVPTPPTVSEGTSPITSVSVTCDSGIINLTALSPVLLAGNGTTAIVLTNGSSTADYNAVLATLTHTRSTHGVTTFNCSVSDGTLSDGENFTRFVSPIGIEFSGTQAQVRALLQSLGVVLDVGESSASLNFYVEDDTSPTPLTDSQTVSLVVLFGVIIILSQGSQSVVFTTSLSGKSQVTTIIAESNDGSPVSYSILSLANGGLDDAGLFTVGASSGILSFIEAPVHGTNADANQDGIYAVTVEISNGDTTIYQQFYIEIIPEFITDIKVYISYDNTGGGVFQEVTNLVQTGTLKWEDELHTRSQASFTLISESATETFYRPSVGANVILQSSAVIIWGGTVERVQEWQETRLPTVLFQNIEIVSYAQLLDRYLVAKAYDNKTLREIIDDISKDELKSVNLNIENVQAGPLIEKAVWNYQNATEVFNDLARITGYTWWVGIGPSANKVLYFVASGTTEAPFILNSRDQIISLSVTRERSDYRNIQYVRAGNDITDSRVESFAGDGENRTFTLAFPVSEITAMTVDDVPVTFGIRGVEEEGTKDFYYQVNNTGVSQDLNSTALSSIEVLEVIYRGFFPLLVIIQDDAEIASRVVIEGGDGRYQNVEEQQDINSAAGAYDYGRGILRQKGLIPETIQFNTRINGLASGQILTVELPWANLSAGYLITKVSIEIEETEPPTFLYNVEAVSGEALGGWAEFWSKLARAGRKFLIRENEVAGPLKYYTEPIEIAESFTSASNASPWGIVSFASSTGEIDQIGWCQVWES